MANKEMTGLEQLKRALVMQLAESLQHYTNGIEDGPPEFTPRPLEGVAPLLIEHAKLASDLDKSCCIEEIRLVLQKHGQRAVSAYAENWGYLEREIRGWSWGSSRIYSPIAPDEVADPVAHALRWFWQDCEYLQECLYDLCEEFGVNYDLS